MLKKIAVLIWGSLALSACEAPKDKFRYAIGFEETYKIILNDEVIIPDGIIKTDEHKHYMLGYMFPVEKWTCEENQYRDTYFLIDEEMYFLLNTQSGVVSYFDDRISFERQLENLHINFDRNYSWFEMYRPITKYVEKIQSPESCQKIRAEISLTNIAK